MAAYDEKKVQEELEKADGWLLDPSNGEIFKEYEFANFVQSLDFVNKVGQIAEEMGHHPDILIKYNRVTLSVATHDEGGLTEKDFTLASRANGIA